MRPPVAAAVVILAGALAISGSAAADDAGRVGPRSQPVRCGDPDIVRGSGVWQASRPFVVRDRKSDRTGIVQAVRSDRNGFEIRVCDERGLLRADQGYVQSAGAPWRELAIDGRTCRQADGLVSASFLRAAESRRELRRRIIGDVRRGASRVTLLPDRRHVVVADRDLPVPTSATIRSRDWLAGCER